VQVGGGAAAADCVTVYAWPAIVIVPLRCAPVLAVTVNDAEPLPVVLAAPEIAIHEAALETVQVHPDVVVTVTGVPAPAVAATVWDVPLSVNEHGMTLAAAA